MSRLFTIRATLAVSSFMTNLDVGIVAFNEEVRHVAFEQLLAKRRERV
jgi:hypothetical protein